MSGRASPRVKRPVRATPFFLSGVVILNLTEVNQDRDFSLAIVLIAYSSSIAAIVATAMVRGHSSVASLYSAALSPITSTSGCW